MSLQRTEIPLRTFCDAKQLDNCSAYSTPPPLWALSGICQVRHSRGWALILFPWVCLGLGNLSLLNFILSIAYVTVRPLEPGHLDEDYPITMLFEKKGFSSFFANRPIKIDVQPCNHATYLTSQETALKFINVIGPFVKKL